MSLGNTALMKAMGAKMNYLDMRQTVLAQNIANADTPGYVSKDLTEVDFGAMLKKISGSQKVSIETTNPLHMPSQNAVEQAKSPKDRLVYEVSPDKNAVVLEEQMVRASKVQMDYNLLTNLMTKHGAIYKAALGRPGQ